MKPRTLRTHQLIKLVTTAWAGASTKLLPYTTTHTDQHGTTFTAIFCSTAVIAALWQRSNAVNPDFNYCFLSHESLVMLIGPELELAQATTNSAHEIKLTINLANQQHIRRKRASLDTFVSGRSRVSVSNLIGAGTSYPSWQHNRWQVTTDRLSDWVNVLRPGTQCIQAAHFRDALPSQSISQLVLRNTDYHCNTALQYTTRRHINVTSSTSLTAFRRRLKSELFLRCFGQDCVWRIFACARLRMHAFMCTFVKCSCSPLDFTTL